MTGGVEPGAAPRPRLVKKCRHGRGLSGHARRAEAWRACGCAWLIMTWDGRARIYSYENVGADPVAAMQALEERVRSPRSSAAKAPATRRGTAVAGAVAATVIARRCATCPTILSRYNPSDTCGACAQRAAA